MNDKFEGYEIREWVIADEREQLDIEAAEKQAGAQKKQLAQTFSTSGLLLGQTFIHNEKEYVELMRRMVDEHGAGVYTVCTDWEEA